jgi:outer membrane protein OmpA-like peptidoglycan-associated protein
MKLVYTIIVFSLLPAIELIAQDGCVYEGSSKVKKLLEQSFDTKKYQTEERIGFLNKALEEDPNCTPCLMRLGEIEFKVAKRGGSFQSAKEHFKQLQSLCNDYHSEVFYYLGAMCYADREYAEAASYFEHFLRFPDGDPTKFAKDYDKKYTEVEEALVHVKIYEEIFSNPVPYSPVKVTGVSSSTDEYLPLISPDGEIMFYTRKVSVQNRGDYAPTIKEEFSWSKRTDINATFDDGASLPSPFNLGNNCGGATITPDNRELIVAMKSPSAKYPDNIDLFSTRYTMTTNAKGEKVYQWGELVNLGERINTPDGFEGQPSLSGDGKTLFFVGVRPDCIPDESGNFSHDIFYSKRQSDGTWGVCKPVGGGVNTSGNEKAPFVHTDSKTLYFSSDGQLGVGGMDLYHGKIGDDGVLTDIKNMGVPINTEADELGIVVSSDGDVAYFGARNFQGSKGWDVFQFKMPEKAKPEKVMVVKGQVKDVSGEAPKNATVDIKYGEDGTKTSFAVNEDDGSFAAVVNVEKSQDIALAVHGENVAFNSVVIVHKDEPTPVVAKVDVETETNKEGEPFIINDIKYKIGKAELESNSLVVLKALAEYLKEHESMRVEIGGHTDNQGDDNANKALSAERAYEVLRYLTEQGVDHARLTYKGYGETKPIGDNKTEEGRAKNRRTEFTILHL